MNNNNQNTPYCSDHGQCIERQNQLIEDVKELKADMVRTKDEIHNIKLQQTKDTEQIKTLYNIIDKLENTMNKINDNMTTLNNKIDKGFKEVNDKIENQNNKQTEKVEQLKAENEKKIEQLRSKPDSFKEAIQKLGMKMLEWAFIGGIIMYISKTFIK